MDADALKRKANNASRHRTTDTTREKRSRMSANQNADAAALQLTKGVYEAIRPDAAVLFGSRARGDHDEHRSDVDIMLIVEQQPDQWKKDEIKDWAVRKAQTTYGRPVPVQLVWFDHSEYEEQERFVNTVVTRALRQGIVMAKNPEDYTSRYDDEETDHQYTWTDYDNRVFHAEQHLFSFQLHIEVGASDLLIGQQAQATLEHALKAVIAGHGEPYPETHNIGNLIGKMRQMDSHMANFALEIHPDVYTEYAGTDEYKDVRRRPPLTHHPNYRDATATAAQRLIERAHQLGPNRPTTGI